MIDVEIYRSIKNPNKFVGYILIPRDGKELTIRFDGPDEQTIMDKAQRFWDTRIVPNLRSSPVDDDDSPSELSSGRGKAHIGTTWMWNKTTGERARVPHDEVKSYLYRGFIKAGPRTK
jgi:hypothetical protein